MLANSLFMRLISASLLLPEERNKFQKCLDAFKILHKHCMASLIIKNHVTKKVRLNDLLVDVIRGTPENQMT